MYPGTPAYRMKPPSQGTAETLVLIAWILQLLGSAVIVGLGVFFFVAGSFFLFAFGGGLFLAGLALVAIVVPILMLYVGYAYSYRRIREGDFAGAKAPTLILGILGLFFGGIVVGILYLIGYAKTSDAENESRSWGAGPGFPGYGYTPGYPGPYSATPWAATGPAPVLPPGSVAYQPPPAAAAVPTHCPRCGKPATYIPQYGRSYCYGCAQYV